MSIVPGILYIVATPIGNLEDMSPRAVKVLGAVDLIAAEDTRRSRPLVARYGIGTRLASFHEHNEQRVREALLTRLSQGASVAVISDAGTPLISDPGFTLVRAAHEAGIPVSPIPGPTAAMAALSASGLPTDRFVFEGFLPRNPAQRRERLKSLRAEQRTLIFYESSHRILATLADLVDQFGALRRGVVARELTKVHETIIADELAALQQRLRDEPDQRKGEFVLLVAGREGASDASGEQAELRRVVGVLLDEDLSVKRVAALAARITGRGRNEAYRLALQLSAS